VIKVEKPDGGDDARLWGPPFGPDGETSLYFSSQNRNKRSIRLDLKLPADVAALHKLCETADILIQNLRPGVVEELGIDGATMVKRHPRLVYCNISAFGRTGPLHDRPGFDPLLQAYGGMMSMTGRPDEAPNFCGASINDKATGMFCTIGVLGALRRRDLTGQGCVVDTSLFDTAVHWVEGAVNNYMRDGTVTKRHGTGANVIVPYQVFQASDLPFVIAAGNDRLFQRCAKVVGHPEWGSDPKYATGRMRVKHKVELVGMIQAEIAKRPRDAWIAALEAEGVPCAAVNDIGELARSEQFAASGIVQTLPVSGVQVVGLPIIFDGERPRSQRPAPALGEHDAELLGR
jgi:crotonobetainyl-CoA:carnitine CoA-transferase CaiB-like acyl-CoA transferase